MSGRALAPLPPPPGDLSARPLPLIPVRAGSSFNRIHRIGRDPVFFSPGPGQPPAGRFDSPTGRFGVLYVALSFQAAFAETLLRNPRRNLVGIGEIEARAFAVLALAADTHVVDLAGPGLSTLGLDARLPSGSYDLCGRWADALHAHPSAPGGILYPSRHDPSERCLAILERPELPLEVVGASLPLTELADDVASALDRYGKALDLAR